jgi:hypothetical protein
MYQQVGVAIRELGPRGDDLWPKYRVINIVRVIENPESRQEAVRSLDAIQVQISHIRTAAPSK